MKHGNFGWRGLVVVGAVALGACTSPTAGQDAGPVVAPPPETHRPPPPAPPEDAGVPRPGGRCAPDEMDCCGACIPKSERVCPVNVHCPTSAPEM